MVKDTDTGTVWMWESRIAESVSLERFPAAVCLEAKMEMEVKRELR